MILPTSEGHMTVKLNINIVATLKLKQDANKKLQISLDSFSFSYNNSDITLSGSILLKSLQYTEYVIYF